MDDDDTVLFAVLAGVGGLAMLSLIFVGVGVVLLLAWPLLDRPVARVATSEIAMATAVPATATVQPSPTAVSIALPVIVAPPAATSTLLAPTQTATSAPAIVMPPISTAVAPAPDTPIPTLTPRPTDTPTPLPSATLVPAPTATLTGWWTESNGYIFTSDCPCDQSNTLNCGDFPRAQDAQACYLRCQELTSTDVHELDRDKDGSACEWDW